MNLNISAFNVCGFKDEFKIETIAKDFMKNKLDVPAIQETHLEDIEHITYNQKDNKV